MNINPFKHIESSFVATSNRLALANIYLDRLLFRLENPSVCGVEETIKEVKKFRLNSDAVTFIIEEDLIRDIAKYNKETEDKKE